MVMEASPSPQSVGREFVRQYYTLLNKAPAHLHRFYNNYSSFVHGGLDAPNRETLPVVGQKQIHNRIQQLNFRDCHAKISQVDAQATLGNGVVVQVTGELSNGGAPMRRFTQTFVLAAQSPKKYYVHNDIFRYQDIVFSDEEGSGSGRSEGEEEEAGGVVAAPAYFPVAPPASAFPAAAFPAPPAPPAPAPHLNGHPPPRDHLVAALQASGISSEPEAEPVTAASPPAPAPAAAPGSPGAGPGLAPPGLGAAPAAPAPAPAPEPVPEPEPEREPTPPPNPPVAPEPKTYANLLKSGPAAAARVSPPAPPAADPRPRPPPAAEGPRRYSDAQQLFLGNLPHCATEEELRALFARFGPVAELRVHSKPAAPGAPRHPNYGFITYETSQAAHDCLNAAPLYFPADAADGVKLNVEEKKTRGREAARRRPQSQHRAFAPRQPYRR
nr:ras GTPase-activating protein-binding protein 2 isoform X2 [Helicoverpa armigera]